MTTETQKEAREALIEQATWVLIDYDTDVADRGVSDEHYRERRADVERVFPILASRAPQPTDDELLETYRVAVDRAMTEAHARDGFASNMSRESIVAGLRAVAGLRRAPAEPAVTEDEAEGEDVFLSRYGIYHASFGGIGGDAIRLDITREAWKEMGEPRSLKVSWTALTEGEKP